jgi:hypothetical protein
MMGRNPVQYIPIPKPFLTPNPPFNTSKAKVLRDMLDSEISQGRWKMDRRDTRDGEQGSW